MLKNECYRNRVKPIPFQSTHRANSGHIFNFSSGLCMRDLSHSDQILKQLKSQRSTGKNVNDDISMTSQSYLSMLTWQKQVLTSGDL
jgi:hypothetical protein